MGPLLRRTALIVGLLVTLSVSAWAGQGAIDLTGKWAFNVETSAGAGMPTITFKQEGEKLSGHYSGQLGESDLTGTVKGQNVTFTFGVEVQGMRLTCTYTGRAESKDAMKGTVDI